MVKELTKEEVKGEYPLLYKIIFNDDYSFNVFVYGTLKQGETNHRVMTSASGEFISTAKLPGYYMVNTPWYPFAAKSDNDDDYIEGELYKVPLEKLHILDTLEGYPQLYDRDVVEFEGIVTGKDLHALEAFIYVNRNKAEMKAYESKYGKVANWTGASHA